MAESRMDALVWTGPRQLVFESVPVPAPAADEILLEVGAVGVCGSELSGYLGQSSLRVPPLIMGHEAAGTVVAVGGGQFGDGSAPQLGARVVFNPLIVCGQCDYCRSGRTSLCRQRQLIGAARPGAFARFVAVPARQCFPLTDDLSFDAGSLAEPLACGVRAVRQGHMQPGASLLIIGAGPIGLCCLVAARAAGITQIAISDVAATRLHVAHDWGAQATINPRGVDVVQAIHDFQAGGVDCVIDAVGTDVTRDQAVYAVAPGGNVVYIGLHEEASPLAANYLVRQEITITGSFAYAEDDFATALGLLEAGALRPTPDWLVDRPLADGPAVFEELISGTAMATKIVLHV